jgi:hypothetical protein
MEYFRNCFELLLVFILFSCKAYSQDSINYWVSIQENALSFKQETTIYLLSGDDFEGDYIFKIQPSTDAFLEKNPVFKKLKVKRFYVFVDLKRRSSGQLIIANVTCNFFRLKDESKSDEYKNIIVEYFSNLNFSLIDPDECIRDFFKLHFIYSNNSY